METAVAPRVVATLLMPSSRSRRGVGGLEANEASMDAAKDAAPKVSQARTGTAPTRDG